MISIIGEIKEILEYRNEINVRLLFKGPLYKGRKTELCFIPLNISLKEKTVEQPERMSVASIYPDILRYEVFAMQKKEIFCEKIRAILTRNKPRDVYDLYHLIKAGESLNISMLNEKLAMYALKFDMKNFVDKVNQKKSLWESDLQNLMFREVPNFDEVKREVIKQLKLTP